MKDGHAADQADAPPPRRGETIGKFVVIGLVGSGAKGDVYAAYDPDLDRKVAVKLLRWQKGSAATGRARLLREAQAIAKLRHPNVVGVYEVGEDRGTVFIAMEFVDGVTLGSWMKGASHGWREVRRVFEAAGRGLAAVHDAGLVHRDFKPENVMITRDGQVRVMDFGLVRALDGAGADADASPLPPAEDVPRRIADGAKLTLTQTGTAVGTPAYMSPEQFLAERFDRCAIGSIQLLRRPARSLLRRAALRGRHAAHSGRQCRGGPIAAAGNDRAGPRLDSPHCLARSRDEPR